MINGLKRVTSSTAFHRSVITAKKLWYGNNGEPIEYRGHLLRYLPGTRPVRLTYADSDDMVVRNDVLQIEFFLDLIESGNFVLDIGGHFGQYAVLFAELVSPSGRVVSFEPDELARVTLRKNLELNNFSERVEIESVALFDQNGAHAFFSKDADSMSSLARSGLGANAVSSNVTEYSVQTQRLDDYLAARRLPVPSCVKLDTEGAEINILKGASELLRTNTTIVCELHPYAWPEFGTSFEELLELVSNGGKSMEYLDPNLKIIDGPQYGAAIIR